MSFSINKKLSFIDSFQFLSSSLAKDDFNYMSQEFTNIVLDLVEQKGLHPYEYMIDFGKFIEKLPKQRKVL